MSHGPLLRYFLYYPADHRDRYNKKGPAFLLNSSGYMCCKHVSLWRSLLCRATYHCRRRIRNYRDSETRKNTSSKKDMGLLTNSSATWMKYFPGSLLFLTHRTYHLLQKLPEPMLFSPMMHWLSPHAGNMQFRRLQHLTGIFQKSKILFALKSETYISPSLLSAVPPQYNPKPLISPDGSGGAWKSEDWNP